MSSPKGKSIEKKKLFFIKMENTIIIHVCAQKLLGIKALVKKLFPELNIYQITFKMLDLKEHKI